MLMINLCIIINIVCFEVGCFSLIMKFKRVGLTRKKGALRSLYYYCYSLLTKGRYEKFGKV